jgi:hypothetical protein
MLKIKRGLKKFKQNNSAVSEVLGTVLILAMSVVILASVYIAAFALPSPSRAPVINAVGMTANDSDIIISHLGGDDLPLDSVLVLTVGGKEIKYEIADLIDAESAEDGYWNIGEELVFNYDIRNLQVEVRIIDPYSNSVVMMGILQEGLLIRDPYTFTLNATDITANSAKLLMKYNFWDKSGDVRFAYRIATSGIWSYTPWVALSGESNQEVTVNALDYNTNYEYKSQLRWGSNQTDGGLKYFTTDEPSIITLDATDVKTRSANVRLQYDFKGLSGAVSFSYKPNGGSWIDTAWVNVSGQGNYNEVLYLLIPKSDYEFKARIKYDIVIREGNTKTFTTWSIIMGRWNFSEATGTTAYDSSGLDNHGTLVGPPNWVPAINTTGLSFDGIDDYIRVYDSSSLDISQQVSIEAWIKPLEKSEGYIGDITGSVIDSSYFGPDYGRDSDIIQITASIYAVAFRGDNDDGYIATFSINSKGYVKNVIDYLEFDTVNCYDPDIIHVDNDFYAIAYEGADFDGFLKTVQILSDGEIKDTVIDSLEYATVNGLDPNIIHINGDIYSIAYTGLNNDGYVTSVEISSTGDINNSVVASTVFFDTESGSAIAEPKIFHVGNTYYAIVFRNPDDDGESRTIEINNDGTFTLLAHFDGSYVDKFVFDGYDGWRPSVVHINGDIYAVAYRGRDGRGSLTTISIDATGVIKEDIADKYYFDSNNCYSPEIMYISGDYYAITYRGVDNDGFIVVVEIAADGAITDSVITSYEFDTSDCYRPRFIFYKDDTYIFAYTNNNQGYIKTINITAAPAISELHVSRYTLFDFNEPDIINVANDVYAIVSQGLNGDGYLRTFSIQNSGDISNSVIDVLEFDNLDGRDNKIINIAGNIFAIIYRGTGDDGYIKTVEILNSGDIKDDTIIDSFEFDTSRCLEPDIINIFGNYYAVTYRGPDDDGYIKTLEITNLGQITDVAIDTLEFEVSYCSEPNIIQVSGDVYVIAYCGPGYDGYVKTVSIMNNGDIVDTVIDYYEYDGSYGYEPEIVNVNNNIFAIVHSYQTVGGYVSTIEIADNGTITKQRIDYLRFDNIQPGGDDDGFDPQIIHIDDWVYGIVYRGEYNAYLKTLKIGDLGDISYNNDDYLLFDSNGYEPQIIHIDGNIYGITYRGANYNAGIKTVEIIPINATWARPVVNKNNAYGLKSDGISVFGCINSNTISAPLSSDYNYVVLTFNSSLSSYQMKLYIDSVLIDEINVSGTINVNSNNLIMGDDYNCIIDEVTVWNIPITASQILTNYNLLKP